MNRPPYPEFPTLRSEHILLRQISSADIEGIIDLSFYDGKAATTALEAGQMQQQINLDYQKGDSIHWGMVSLEGDGIVGTCGYYRGFADDSGELGFVLRPQFEGRGFMTMALQLAIGYGFDCIGLRRITATTTQDNDKAVRLLGRLGFAKSVSELEENYVEYELLKELRIR